MDATKWTQGFQEMMNIKPMEQMMNIPNNNNTTSNNAIRPNTILTNNGDVSAAARATTKKNTAGVVVEKKERAQEKANCPRCNSTNTKFCYYNNYSLTQPRYFCKGCRRYWTEGGSLRNVPVGGTSRKNKRYSSSSNQNPNKPKESSSSQDLNLMSFPHVMQDQQHHYVHMSHQFLQQHPSSTSYSSSRPGMINSFVPSGSMMGLTNNNVLYTTSSLGFPTMVDYKPSNLSFSTDHQGLGNNNNNNNISHQGMVLFPKELSSSISQEVDHDNNQQHKSQGDNNNNDNSNTNNGYWSGMFSNT
ncbi:unnamed protein product [Cochlearia groenlandica]